MEPVDADPCRPDGVPGSLVYLLWFMQNKLHDRIFSGGDILMSKSIEFMLQNEEFKERKWDEMNENL